jgi:hypothetical protein
MQDMPIPRVFLAIVRGETKDVRTSSKMLRSAPVRSRIVAASLRAAFFHTRFLNADAVFFVVL